ncbi:MAG TPA: PIG-L family deacetylase [Acidimicrobiia bacterium]|nr:PIG-L family deacetylase [Acidimicrobiia bacterium]
MPNVGELDRIVVVSPHLDDAVLGCGRLLAAHPGTTVVTVFAGVPPAYPDPMRPWDVQCGFAPGDDVMAARRAEDRAALAVLGAIPRWLDGIEYSYRPDDLPETADDVVARLAPVIEELDPSLVVVPFGLANPDHDVTHRACIAIRATHPDIAWWCYEDTGYKHIPGLLAWRVSGLFRAGLWPTPVAAPVAADDTAKQAALACYPSQLRALEDDWHLSAKLAAPAPEQLWRLDAPPPGWEGLSA